MNVCRRLFLLLPIGVLIALLGGAGNARIAQLDPSRMFLAQAPASAAAAASGPRLPFAIVAEGGVSGITRARNVVIRDQHAWNKLWREHAATLASPGPQPQVDFDRHMLVGVFVGARACSIAQIHRVGMEQGALMVDYRTEEERAACAPGVWTPMQLVTVARTDGEVKFNPVKLEHLPFASIEQASYSQVDDARNLVITDARSWSALWHEHSGRDAPQVDFSKSMVVAVFVGARPEGCHGTAILDIVRADGRIDVRTVQSHGVKESCTGSTAPVHLVQIARSDDRVEFSPPLQIIN